MTKTRRRLTLADLKLAERERIAACFHEAGHAVACAVLGGRIHSAVVADSRVWGLRGHTAFDHLPDSINARTTYAGIWAEARWLHGPAPRLIDLRRLRVANGSDDAALLVGAEPLPRGVEPVMERCWPAVTRVAQQLFGVGETTHDDVLAALDVTDGGGTGSAQLANLRAGLRGVPPIGAATA